MKTWEWLLLGAAVGIYVFARSKVGQAVQDLVTQASAGGLWRGPNGGAGSTLGPSTATVVAAAPTGVAAKQDFGAGTANQWVSRGIGTEFTQPSGKNGQMTLYGGYTPLSVHSAVMQ